MNAKFLRNVLVRGRSPVKRLWNIWKEIFSSLILSLTKRFNTAKNKYNDHKCIDNILLSSPDSCFVQMFFVDLYIACTEVTAVFFVDSSLQQCLLSH